jgi:DNA-binding NarL/FixJ family response regulator
VIRVLIVDDHPLLRAGIRARLAGEPDLVVVGEAATTEEAVAQTRAHRPDVVLLDLLLPKRGGCETIPELLAISPRPRVVILSCQTAPSSVQRALAAGAAGYVSKSASDREVVAAIRKVAHGDGYIDPALGARLAMDVPPPPLHSLSGRERDVMRLLALGYTNREVADRLFISARTVDAHRAHIMEKLDLGSRAELVMCALSSGIIGP